MYPSHLLQTPISHSDPLPKIRTSPQPASSSPLSEKSSALLGTARWGCSLSKALTRELRADSSWKDHYWLRIDPRIPAYVGVAICRAATAPRLSRSRRIYAEPGPVPAVPAAPDGSWGPGGTPSGSAPHGTRCWQSRRLKRVAVMKTAWEWDACFRLYSCHLSFTVTFLNISHGYSRYLLERHLWLQPQWSGCLVGWEAECHEKEIEPGQQAIGEVLWPRIWSRNGYLLLSWS